MDAIIEDIKDIQKRWEPYEKKVIWEMAEEMLNTDVEPLKIDENYQYQSVNDMIARVKHGMPITFL
jgi:hypothetical protein